MSKTASIKPKIKTPVSYYGGKQMMLKYILPLIPKHDLYVEPFCGGAAVFWAKAPVRNEVINDLNGEVANFYKVLKSDFKNLLKLVKSTLHSRRDYEDAMVVYKNPHLFTDLKRAWAFWVATSQSFASSIGGGWSYDRGVKNTRATSVHYKREGFLDLYEQRLSRVSIENRSAIKVIEGRNVENAFFYCDPPYHNADQGHYAGYKESDFIDLLEVLSKVKGKFLLSSYPSDVLKSYAEKHGWHQKSIKKTVSVTLHKKKKVEVLTANYDING